MDLFYPPGYPPADDPEVVRLMKSADALTDDERPGDVSHLTRWRDNLLGSLHLRRNPEYVEAIRRPARRGGRPRPIGEVLASLGLRS